jgi:hypothetical protein
MTEEQEASRPLNMTMGDQRSDTPWHRLHLLSHSDQPTAVQAVQRAIDQRSSPGKNITVMGWSTGYRTITTRDDITSAICIAVYLARK